MIKIERVTTKQQQKDFLNFPLKLYKGNPYFTPPLMMDERKIFKQDFVYNDICDAVYFNAYKDGGNRCDLPVSMSSKTWRWQRHCSMR